MARTLDYRSERPRSRVVELVFSVVLLLTLCAPGVFTFVKLPSDLQMAQRENRRKRPAPRPQPGRLAEYPGNFRDWFGRNFGLRAGMVQLHARVWYEYFDLSPKEIMVLGRDDWLFTTASRSLDSERGVIPFEEAELEAWRRTLEARRDWLASRGIDYAFVVVPDKPSIYPELLPDAYAKVAPSRPDQLFDYMREHSDVRVLDLTSAMLEGKALDRDDDHAFYPLGTHWTPRGAFHGYRMILDELNDWIADDDPWTLDQFKRPEDPHDDDESRALYLDDRMSQLERKMVPTRRRFARLQQKEVGSRPDVMDLWVHKDQSLPRLHLIHDSSAQALKPYLAQHFSRTTGDKTDSFAAWSILKTEPDLVMQVYVARCTQRIQPPVQTMFEEAEIRERFQASKRIMRVGMPEGRYPRLNGYQGTRVEGGGEEPLVVKLASISEGCLISYVPDSLPDEMMVLRIELVAPADSVASLYYMEAESQGYRHQRCETIPVSEGHNELFLMLASPTMLGPLLLRPGYQPGDYEIHDVEVRAIPR